VKVLCLLASNMRDMKVYSKDMVALGKVKDMQFDSTEMKVTGFIVEFDKQSAKELMSKRFVIRHSDGQVPSSLIESVKDAMILKQPWKDLKGTIEST
jgi:sporulation protein YlmC with PRC-barrel domain